MALPSIRSPLTMAPPKKANNGLFLGANDLDSPFASTDTWGSTGSKARPNYGVLTISPRNLIESTGSLAPLDWSRTAIVKPTGRTKTDGKEFVEAQRALRGIVPGDWDAAIYAKFKKKFTHEGRWLAIPKLLSIAFKASENALNTGGYMVPSAKGTKIRLSQRPSGCWICLESLPDPDVYKGTPPPPLIVSHRTPLEAAGALGKVYKGRQIIVTLEAVDFSKPEPSSARVIEGRLLEGLDARSEAQQELYICTNFKYHSRMAAQLCPPGVSPKDRLCANHKPSIFSAQNVTLFRGAADNGYPFLAQDEQVSLEVLVTGRAVKRPTLMPKSEVFWNEEDLLSFMERLNMLTYRALSSDPGGSKPILVLAAAGLTQPEHQQPRLSIAQALRTWRSLYANLFEAVVVACGDQPTASFIDREVNLDVYMKVLQNQAVEPGPYEWHWNPQVLHLSNNPVFGYLGSRLALVRMMRPASKEPQGRTSGTSEMPSVVQTGQFVRRASGLANMLLADAMAERPAGAVLQKQAKTLPEVALHLDEIGSLSPTSPGQPRRMSNARRASNAFGVGGAAEDSRHQYDRLLADRKAAIKDKELEAFAATYHHDAPQKVLSTPASTMTLERKRQIDNQAAQYHMPHDLHIFTFKAIEKECKAHTVEEPEPPAPTSPSKKGNQTQKKDEKKQQDEEDEARAKESAKETVNLQALHLFEELRLLATSLDTELTTRRQLVACGPLSARTPRKLAPLTR